jgi:hypothetical protein
MRILVVLPILGIMPISLQHFLSPLPPEIGVLVRTGI